MTLIVASVALQSCSGDSAAPDTSPMANLAGLSGQLIEVSQSTAKHFNPPDEPILPADLNVHLQTQFESFSLQALLYYDDSELASGEVPAAALIAQLDRFALQPESVADKLNSQWQYDGIVRSSVFVDTVAPNDASLVDADAAKLEAISALGLLERIDTVQRMALDLAGATEQSLWVGRDRINIVIPKQEFSSCNRRYRWVSVLSSWQQIALDFSVADCPSINALEEINTWAESGIEVTGMLTSQRPTGEQTNRDVSGTAWLRQSWGNIPVPAGAVVIDSLTMTLDEGRRLDVTRSRRRSGRGPQTVTATLYRQGQSSAMLDVAWEDSVEQLSNNSGRSYPARVTLRSKDGSLEVHARVMNRLSESNVGSDVRAHVPVVVSGSYTGAGFLSFAALPSVPVH